MKNTLFRPTLSAAISAWCVLDTCGLGSQVVWHTLFSTWGLCGCERCVYADTDGGA